MFWWDPRYLIFALPALLLAFYAQMRVKSAYNRHSRKPNARGLSGYEAARILLRSAGLDHVRVGEVPGRLSDHYDPKKNELRLSQGVARSRSVAALGIATTLTVLVLERSRQLNTLFAVGASFRQIRSMIFWEAVLMIVAGEIGGLICGFFLSYLLVFVINKESFGWTFHYGVNWVVLSFSLPLIFVIALLSALPAAQMVFREPPATVLRQ